MIIHRLPSFVQSLFRPLRRNLAKPHVAHLQAFVLALLMITRKANLRHLAETPLERRHRTSLGVFLRADWDPVALLSGQAMRTLAAMKPRKGDVIYLVLDDTRIVKRAKKMDGVSKLWDHTNQRFAHGHVVVTAAILFRGVMLPWRLELWLSKEWAGREFRKTTHIAADLIREFVPPKGLKVRVLFDAFYLCPPVVHACRDRGFHWFSVASKNRTLTRTTGKRRGQKRRIKDFAPGVLKYQGHRVRLPRTRGWRWMRIAAVDGNLAKVGAVRMVFSKRRNDPWKKLLAVVTDETKLQPREILAVYEKRWSIEVLFKELRGSLGLGDYQVVHKEAILRHLHLCCLAHLTLTHHSLRAAGAQVNQAKKELCLPPMSERLETIRAAVRQDETERLVKRIKQRSTRKLVRDYLLLA